MKKILLSSLMAVIGTLLFSVTAMAATTASITPASVKVAVGQQFNMVVMVDPKGFSNYAEKIEVDYPADALQMTSFTLGTGGMALSQTGYDLNDPVNGVLIKTAGYAGGISSPTLFGTILFTAKKSGSGMVTIGGQSSAFETSGQSAITGKQATFTVTAVNILPKNVVPNKPSSQAALAPVSSINGQVLEATATNATVVGVSNGSELAQVGTAASTGIDFANIWIYITIVVIVIILVVGYLVLKKKRI